MSPIRVLVVDDHFIVRSGIAASLQIEHDLEVIGEAATEEEAMELVGVRHPDIVLLDLKLERNRSGVDVTLRIAQDFPNVRVLIFTTFDGDEYVYRAFQAGARGYLLKSASRDEIIAAIRTVAAGNRYVPPEIAGRIAERTTAEELSRRELDVLQRVAKGRSNKEIAHEIGISDETVKSHVSSILAKLRVVDRTQAVTEAIRRGFIGI